MKSYVVSKYEMVVLNHKSEGVHKVLFRGSKRECKKWLRIKTATKIEELEVYAIRFEPTDKSIFRIENAIVIASVLLSIVAVVVTIWITK